MPFQVVVACLACIDIPTGRPPAVAVIDGARQDDCYEFTCPNGHTSATFLQMEKFETLFELGLAALIDRYPREAVTAFYASLERFYEWSLQVIFMARIGDSFYETWRSGVGKQSERTIGAFHSAWAMEFGEPAPAFPTKLVQLRNEAIHEGLIPDNESAARFGEAVFDYERPLMLRLRERHQDAIHAVRIRRWPTSKQNVTASAQPSCLGLDRVDPEYLAKTFREHLSERPIRWMLRE
jgi:hypothetical protein